MSRTLSYRAPARQEFDKAVNWYLTHSIQVSEDFIHSVNQVINEILSKPKRYPLYYQDIREAPVPGYPFCVYYRVVPTRIVVVSVFHQSRDPAILLTRR